MFFLVWVSGVARKPWKSCCININCSTLLCVRVCVCVCKVPLGHSNFLTHNYHCWIVSSRLIIAIFQMALKSAVRATPSESSPHTVKMYVQFMLPKSAFLFCFLWQLFSNPPRPKLFLYLIPCPTSITSFLLSLTPDLVCSVVDLWSFSLLTSLHVED